MKSLRSKAENKTAWNYEISSNNLLIVPFIEIYINFWKKLIKIIVL